MDESLTVPTKLNEEEVCAACCSCVRGIYLGCRTILSLSMKTSLGGYEPAGDRMYHVISYPNQMTRKGMSTTRESFVFSFVH